MARSTTRPDQRRFLETVLRHAERLNAIIEDLLTLSRIEQEADHQQIEVVDIRVERVLQQAVQACELRAAEKQITVVLDAAAETWRANAALLEEAVANLIDNAIKYSEPGSQVEVAARTAGPTHQITVTTTVKASPPNTCPGCSSGSTAWTRRAAETWAGPGSGSPS